MIWGGSSADILKAAEEGRITVLVSEEIVEEISRILLYHKLSETYREAGVSHEELMETVLRIGKLVRVETRLEVIREDTSDNKFLECVIESNADYIVSGDEHVLKVGRYNRTEIVSARQFIRLLDDYS
jgi:putative PIN family toxin of toxin-antitoxin system